MRIEEAAREVVDTSFRIYRDLGPGLLESVYERILAKRLSSLGLRVDRNREFSFEYEGLYFEHALRIDVLVEDALVVEIKSIERLAPVHSKQLLTYLRLAKRPLGLLINFGADQFRNSVKRLVNNHTDFEGSNLRVHG